MSRRMRDRKPRRWLDDLKREKIERLARYGFSRRCIAEQVLGIPSTEDSYEADRARATVSTHLHSVGIRLTDYRNGTSLIGRGKIREALSTKNKRRRSA